MVWMLFPLSLASAALDSCHWEAVYTITLAGNHQKFPSHVFKLEQPGRLQNASVIAALPFLSFKILAPRRVSKK